jgi:hypothetical protein
MFILHSVSNFLRLDACIKETDDICYFKKFSGGYTPGPPLIWEGKAGEGKGGEGGRGN